MYAIFILDACALLGEPGYATCAHRNSSTLHLKLRAIYCSRATLNYRIIIYGQLFHQNYNDGHMLNLNGFVDDVT